MIRPLTTSIEQLDFVHCLIQELEGQHIVLPMGDYHLIYDYIEGAREILIQREAELEQGNLD